MEYPLRWTENIYIVLYVLGAGLSFVLYAEHI